PALRALLEDFIDYAGIFPPAALTLDSAIEKYNNYRNGQYSWMLRWLVVSAADVQRIPQNLDGKLSVLSDSEEHRAACIESKKIVTAQRPVYCEIPLRDLSSLDALKQAGCFAKIRTGGVQPEAI